ncbi:MAG: hypothetical protein Q8858_10130 [Bacteroidota bacterium]|nr:hypothetical protein [Bacteroidota bacterium]MDP4196925.1 hypothetical protein [Bacteroidota bacterium]
MKFNGSIILLLIIVSLLQIFSGCSFIDVPTDSTVDRQDINIDVSIAKWYDNHKGAISLTNDDTWMSEGQKDARKFLKTYGMTMDYEVLTSAWENDMNAVHYFVDSLASQGTGYFGHGHHHVNHDALSYESDLADFKKCYELMKSFGMTPISYAYPGGFGHHIVTQNALHDAGFLSGRMFEKLDFDNPFIVPEDQKEPSDWYSLPVLIMESLDYDGCELCVNNTEKLIPYLDQCINKNAWIILTYHSLNNTSGFGYYLLSDFKKDVLAISQRDFWQSSMDRVTLYIKEREKAVSTVSWCRNESNSSDSIKIKIDDNLPDSVYYQPLTILFQLPLSWQNKKINVVHNNKIINQVIFTSPEARISLLPTELPYYLLLDK